MIERRRGAGWPLLGLLGVLAAGPARPVPAQSAPSPPRPASATPHAHAEGDLAGVVRDSAGTPLAAAHVRILELHRDYLTHDDGRFAFGDLPAGRYTVAVRRLGYLTLTRPVDVRAGAAGTLDLVLVASPLQLSASVVTGTIVERAREDVLSPTSVLADAALDRRLEGTVAATLQGQPGVAVGSLGPATARPVIRGLSGDRILVLEDGQRPGDLSATSADHGVAVDPLTARSIEVVRGPMSLLYGSSALGGVVNVVRDEVPSARSEHLHGWATAQGASVNRSATVGAAVTAPLGPLAVRAEGSARTAGDLRTPVGALRNTALRSYNGALGASYVGRDGHAGGSYRFFENRYGIPGGFVGAHPNGVDVEMRRHTVRAEGDLHHHVGPFADVRAVAAVTDYDHAEREASGRIGTRFGQVLAQGEVVARHEGLGRLAQGAVGTRVQFRDVVTGGSLRTPSTQDVSLAGFVVEELGAGPLRLQGGFRYDWARFAPREREFVVVREERIPTLPRTFGSFSGSLGVLWAPSEALRVGGSVARAYRTPDINELYSDGPHLAAYSYDVGNPRLGDETGVGTDVFVRWTRPRLRAEVAGFANRLSGYIYPRNTGEIGRQGGRPKFQYTGVDARLAGGEAEVEWTVLPRVVVDGALSYVRGAIRGTPDSLPALDGLPARIGSRHLPFVPPLNGRVGVRYDRPRLFAGVGARGAARQERLGDFEEPTAGWLIGDVNAGVRLLVGSRLHTVTLRVDNLLDQEYREHLSRTKAIMPEAGRNVTLLYRVGF